MKKMHITVNGVMFDVEVEVYADDEQYSYVTGANQVAPQVRQDNYSNVHTNSLMNQQIQKTKLKETESNINALSSPINGTVLEILIKEGDNIKEHDRLLVIESMKMKTDISSPRAGKISSIDIKIGDNIEAGQILLKYE